MFACPIRNPWEHTAPMMLIHVLQRAPGCHSTLLTWVVSVWMLRGGSAPTLISHCLLCSANLNVHWPEFCLKFKKIVVTYARRIKQKNTTVTRGKKAAWRLLYCFSYTTCTADGLYVVHAVKFFLFTKRGYMGCVTLVLHSENSLWQESSKEYWT